MAGAAGFSFALSVAQVTLPLLALAAGYSTVAVGVLTALAAVSQLLMRLVIAALMRRYPDWVLIMLAALLLATGTAVVALSDALLPFVLCELMQGAARGAFWTGSQTHVVRGSGSAVAAMSKVNLASASGLLGGPLIAGFIAERSLLVALLVTVGVSLLACVPAMLLDRLPPFAKVRDRSAGILWRRPGVDIGCWAGVTAGSWRGLIGSYVPVALAGVGQPAGVIGALVSVANAASLAGAGAAGRLRPHQMRPGFVVATLCCGLAMAPVALAAGSAPMAGALLGVSGFGAGFLQTVGPALAIDAVHPDERGDAIAVAGTFRSGALFASPMIVAGLLGVITVGGAMVVVGVAAAMSAIASRRPARAPSTPAAGDAQANTLDLGEGNQ
ncbi:MAG: MFS transporter [Sciscionella sp.]